jgi:hypothetical protein
MATNAFAGALSQPSQLAINGTLHGVSAGSLRQVLAGLKGCSENVRRLRVVYAQQSTTIDFAPIARHNRIEIMTTPTSGVRGMG